MGPSPSKTMVNAATVEPTEDRYREVIYLSIPNRPSRTHCHGHEVSVSATVAPSVGSAQVLMHRDGSAKVVEGFTVKATSFTTKTP
jgi:hypothetical protein